MSEVPSKWLDELADHARRRLATIEVDRVTKRIIIDMRRQNAELNAAQSSTIGKYRCLHCAEFLEQERVDKWKQVQKRTLKVAIECDRCKQITWLDRTGGRSSVG